MPLRGMTVAVVRHVDPALLRGPCRGKPLRVDLDFCSLWDLRHARPPSPVV
jgi:hypothetical protein